MRPRKVSSAMSMKPRTFVVKYRYVSMCEVAIEAKDEAEARQKFQDGDYAWGTTRELDSIDSELVSIKEEP